jgi:hypothetical protein
VPLAGDGESPGSSRGGGGAAEVVGEGVDVVFGGVPGVHEAAETVAEEVVEAPAGAMQGRDGGFGQAGAGRERGIARRIVPMRREDVAGLSACLTTAK